MFLKEYAFYQKLTTLPIYLIHLALIGFEANVYDVTVKVKFVTNCFA